ncbi:MAG: hypothetical protein ACOYCB_11510 [Fastidiosipilaceae bacterium]
MRSPRVAIRASQNPARVFHRNPTAVGIGDVPQIGRRVDGEHGPVTELQMMYDGIKLVRGVVPPIVVAARFVCVKLRLCSLFNVIYIPQPHLLLRGGVGICNVPHVIFHRLQQRLIDGCSCFRYVRRSRDQLYSIIS